MTISVGQGTTKSRYLKIFKSQYLSEFLRYRPDFLHVIITFIGFQITFSIMGSYNTPPFISEVVSNCPFTHAFSAESETLALTGLTLAGVFYFELMSKQSNFDPVSSSNVST